MLREAIAFKLKREAAYRHRQPKSMLFRLPSQLVTLINEDTERDQGIIEWVYSEALEMGATRALGVRYGMQAFIADGDKSIKGERTPEYELPMRMSNYKIKPTDAEVTTRIAGPPAHLAEVTARLTSDSFETFMVDGIRILGALATHPDTDLIVATDRMAMHPKIGALQLTYAAKVSPHLEYSKFMSPLPKEFR